MQTKFAFEYLNTAADYKGLEMSLEHSFDQEYGALYQIKTGIKLLRKKQKLPGYASDFVYARHPKRHVV